LYEYKKNDKAKARFYLEQCETLYSELAKSFPSAVSYQNGLNQVRNELSNLGLSPSVFDMDTTRKSSNELATYRNAMTSISTDAEKAIPQSKIVEIFENLFRLYKPNKADSVALSNEYGSLSWLRLFARQFTDAEKAVNRALQLDPTQTWVKTNLAHALLLQNRYPEAEKIYAELKHLKDPQGKPFAKSCLEDLDALEKVGLTNADVSKIRALLNQ